MRRLALTALGGALLLTFSLAAAGLAEARPVSNGGESLSDWGAYTTRVAGDGQGYALAATVELDGTYNSSQDITGKWRIAVSDRGPNAARWAPEQVISALGAFPTPYQSFPNAPDTIAVGLAPGTGAAVVAWVQTVSGVKRVQVATRPTRDAPFVAPTTLPADTRCGTLDRFDGIEVAFDGSGGHLMYQAVCGSGGRYRTYVPLSVSGSIGTSFEPPGLLAGEASGSLVRLGTQTHAITINAFNGKVMDYPLGASSVDDANAQTISAATVDLVSSGTNTQLNAVSNGTRLVAAFRGTDGGTTKVGFVTVQGGLVTPAWFDPAPGSYPFDPVVSISPNGTIAAAWLEDGKAWAAYQRPGQAWTAPVVVNDAAGEGLLQKSVRVVATDSTVHVLWDTQVTSSGVTSFTLWASVADLTAGSPSFTAPEIAISGGIYASATGVTNGGVRVVAPEASYPLIAPARYNDLVIGDARPATLTVTGLSSKVGQPGTIRVAVTLDGAPVQDGSVFLSGATSGLRFLDRTGVVTFPVPSTLAAGPHTTFVVFSADNGLIGGAAQTVTYTVGKGQPKVKAKAKPRPTTKHGGSLKVSVDSGAPAAATGKLKAILKLGATKVTVKGTLKKGKATLKLPKLAAGSWKVTVSYAGDQELEKGSDSLTLKVM